MRRCKHRIVTNSRIFETGKDEWNLFIQIYFKCNCCLQNTTLLNSTLKFYFTQYKILPHARTYALTRTRACVRAFLLCGNYLIYQTRVTAYVRANKVFFKLLFSYFHPFRIQNPSYATGIRNAGIRSICVHCIRA